jgi:hypothetical protein
MNAAPARYVKAIMDKIAFAGLGSVACAKTTFHSRFGGRTRQSVEGARNPGPSNFGALNGGCQNLTTARTTAASESRAITRGQKCGRTSGGTTGELPRRDSDIPLTDTLGMVKHMRPDERFPSHCFHPVWNSRTEMMKSVTPGSSHNIAVLQGNIPWPLTDFGVHSRVNCKFLTVVAAPGAALPSVRAFYNSRSQLFHFHSN